MKLTLALLLSFWVSFVFGQNVTDSTAINITFRVFSEPLKIEQVSDTLNLDYSKPEDLVKSFYSANSEKWIKSLYLEEPKQIIQDKVHFDAVKIRDRSKNFAQIDSWIHVQKNDFLFVKYAMTIQDFPFPIISVLSLRKANNRWYIQDQLNQEFITTVLANFEALVLNNILSENGSNETEKEVAAKSRRNNLLSFELLEKMYSNFIDKKVKKALSQLRDKRLLGEGSFGTLPIRTPHFKEFSYTVENPFQ